MKNEKLGFIKRLIGGKKTKTSSCCGTFELEEVPENIDNKGTVDDNKNIKKGSCCCNFEVEEIPDESGKDK